MGQNKILIIGLGSIGKRHYNNLSQMGYKNVSVYDPDAAKIEFCEESSRVGKLDEASLKEFNIVFICNPTNEHVNSALLCARAGCHLFIEKPLSHTFDNIDELKELCAKNQLISLIGCNLRFHPCLEFIKNYIKEGKLGKIYSVHHECGTYLPYWRPTQDYRKNYATRKSTGGGVIFDLIHEFDLLFWLCDFRQVKESKFIFDKSSDLEMETEDNCIAAFKFTDGILGSVRVDYLQQSYTRNCKIVGSLGNIEWSFKENIVWLRDKEKSQQLFTVENYDNNNMYINEIRYFLDCVQKNGQTSNGVQQSTEVLKYLIERK